MLDSKPALHLEIRMLLFDEFFKMVVRLVTNFASCTKNTCLKFVKLQCVNIFQFSTNQVDIIMWYSETKLKNTTRVHYPNHQSLYHNKLLVRPNCCRHSLLETSRPY